MSILHIAAFNGYEEDCRMIINACKYWTDNIPALASIGWNNPASNNNDDDDCCSVNSADSMIHRQLSESSTLSNTSSVASAATANSTTKAAGANKNQTTKQPAKPTQTTTKDSTASVTSATSTKGAGTSTKGSGATTDEDNKGKSGKKQSQKKKKKVIYLCKLNSIVEYRQRSSCPYRGTPKQRSRVRTS
jgi:cobalamin biosynthesis Mg chelatase CobN